MSPKLAKQINVEREQLRRLIAIHSKLLVNCASHIPNDIELSALAALLHSFYTGVENIFKRVRLSLMVKRRAARHGIGNFLM